MRGIILAGGTGSRLHPVTFGVSKQLMPVYDKPMIYYPLSTLMLAGIREILVVTSPLDAEDFGRLLGDGSQFGIELTYAQQPKAQGVAHALVIGADFVEDRSVALALGDNIFFGPKVGRRLGRFRDTTGATIFAHQVAEPARYAVVELDDTGKPLSIEEKPHKPRSGYAVPGLYFYDNSVLQIARDTSPSPRGLLEITDVNRTYLEQGRLDVQVLGAGNTWLDAGTFGSLLDASNFVRTVQQRQGLSIGVPEEVAWRQGFITDADLEERGRLLRSSGYGDYLLGLVASRRSR